MNPPRSQAGLFVVARNTGSSICAALPSLERVNGERSALALDACEGSDFCVRGTTLNPAFPQAQDDALGFFSYTAGAIGTRFRVAH
jgi:hypothetical protein